MKKKQKIPRNIFTQFSLFVLLSALVDNDSRKRLDYALTENQILHNRILKATGRKRIYLTNDQRRLLAIKGKAIGIKALGELTDLFSPATIIGWYRKFVASKYDGSKIRKGGMPKVRKEVIDLVLKLAEENRGWGYRRIQSMMDYLNVKVSATTVRRIMRDHGFDPDPNKKKKSTWNQFIKSHMHVMAATDFFHVEVLTLKGLVRCSVLFFIELNTRRVHIMPSRVDPDGPWTEQQAKNICNFDDGIFDGRRYLIHDRDTMFMDTKFREILEHAGVECVETAPKSPNQNSYAESFVGRAREDLFDKMIFTSQAQLDYALTQYETYYNHHRPHRGLGGKMIDPLPNDNDGEIICHEFMGGLLKGYQRVKKEPDIAA